jgi:hypothetical protein
MTSQSDIRSWFKRGVEDGYEFMLIVCDTYDYGDFPVYTDKETFDERYAMHSNPKHMSKIMEVYNLKMDMESQLAEHRAFNIYLKECVAHD